LCRRACGEQRLVVADAGGLHALLALLGDEGDSLALLKGLEAVLLWWGSVMDLAVMRLSRCATTYLDGTEVDEEVGGAVLGGDETVSLLVVEPLDGAVLAVGGSGGVHFDGCVWDVLVESGWYWWMEGVLELRMSRVLVEGIE